jgi:hypothetical protein
MFGLFKPAIHKLKSKADIAGLLQVIHSSDSPSELYFLRA